MWRLETTHRSADWVGYWLTALLGQEMVRTRTRTSTRDPDLAYAHAIDPDLDPDRAIGPDRALDLACAHDLDRAFDLDLDPDPDRALELDFALDRARTFDRARALTYHHISWKLSLTSHLLPETFAANLSRSLPALGVCGLKGRAGDGWLVAPGWIEWDCPASVGIGVFLDLS